MLQKSHSWIIRWILISGILVRIALALSRNDLVWPDEHFMSLEPASKIVFNRAYLAWEWNEGFRAWTLPLFYTPILWICKFCGISGGLIPIDASRVFTVFFSSFALLKFYELLQLLELGYLASLITFAGFSLATPMVLWGVTSLADHWVMILWLCVLPTCIRLSRRHENGDEFKMGLLAGLPILVKPQSGLLAFALLFGILRNQKKIEKAAFYCLGVLINVLILGFLDQIAYGKFLSSLIQHWNRGKSISNFYGVSPWYDYFPRLWNDQGGVFFILLGITILLSFNGWKRRVQEHFFKGDLFEFVILPSLVYFFFHLMIPHKETRFLLPILPALYLMGGWVLQFIPQRIVLESWISQRRVQWFVAPLLIGVMSFVSFSRALKADIYLTSVNISLLEDQIYQLQAQSGSKKTCLLLLDHHWSWTRGKLILGEHVEVIEKQLSEIQPALASSCRYVILKENHVQEFTSRAESSSWSFVKRTLHGFALLQNRDSH